MFRQGYERQTISRKVWKSDPWYNGAHCDAARFDTLLPPLRRTGRENEKNMTLPPTVNASTMSRNTLTVKLQHRKYKDTTDVDTLIWMLSPNCARDCSGCYNMVMDGDIINIFVFPYTEDHRVVRLNVLLYRNTFFLIITRLTPLRVSIECSENARSNSITN